MIKDSVKLCVPCVSVLKKIKIQHRDTEITKLHREKIIIFAP